MARPGFFNDNINRDYPFLHDWFDGHKVLDTDPDSPTYKECVETRINSPLPDWRVRDLPDYAVADFGCVTGVSSGYIEGVHSVWLQQMRRAGSTISYEFHSDAPGLAGRALIFSRDITATDFVTEMVSDSAATDGALFGWPACGTPQSNKPTAAASEAPLSDTMVAVCGADLPASDHLGSYGPLGIAFKVDWGTVVPDAYGYIVELWNVTDNVLLRRAGEVDDCSGIVPVDASGLGSEGSTDQVFLFSWHDYMTECKTYMVKMWFYGGAKAKCDGSLLAYKESNTFYCCPEDKEFCNWCFFNEGQIEKGTAANPHPWEEISPWFIHFDFEDSVNCGGCNGGTQSGEASKCFSLTEDTPITINLSGKVETQDLDYDRIKVVVTDNLTGEVVAKMSDASDSVSGGCETAERLSTLAITLGPGEYKVEVCVTSVDGLYHNGLFWNVEVLGLGVEHERSPCCPCDPVDCNFELASSVSREVITEPSGSCEPCEVCEYDSPDCSTTSPPLWEGYMVSGSMDRLSTSLPDCKIVQGPIPLEPALIQNLAGGHVQSVGVANAKRTRVTSAEGCRDLCFEEEVCETDCISCGCVNGDVLFKEGYNSAIRQDDLGNTLTFSGVVGGGAGEPCAEVPICESEKNVIANSPGITTLSGGPTCSDVLMSINGVGSKYFSIYSGKGVNITPYPDFNRVVIDVNLEALALCVDDYEDVCVSSPTYSTDPCDCGPSISPSTADGTNSYNVACVSGTWDTLVPGINSSVANSVNAGPVSMAWGANSLGTQEKLSFKGTSPLAAKVNIKTDHILGRITYAYENITEYLLTGVTLQLDVAMSGSNKVNSNHPLPLTINEGTISLDKDIPFTIKSAAGIEMIIVGFKSLADETISKSFTTAEGTATSVDLVVQFKGQDGAPYPDTDPLHSLCDQT
tara:strand:+ start:964 stop:3711 length:2748 start_codon:yes stop_codon:yes gene_type:complete